MNNRTIIQTVIVLTGALSSGLACAGATQGGGGAPIGDITHSPTLDAIGVPALGGFGLLALAALLGLFGYRVIKSKHGAGTQWLLAACVVSALAAGSGGIKLISDAYAIVTVQFTDENGDTLELALGDVIFADLNGGFFCDFPNGGGNGGREAAIPITNATGAIQYITDISISGGPCIPRELGVQAINGGNGGYLGACTDFPPLEMAPSDSCEIGVCCLDLP